MTSTEPGAFLVEYRIAGLTFRVSVQARIEAATERVIVHIAATEKEAS